MSATVMLDAGAVSRCRRRVHLEHDPEAAGACRAPGDPAAEQRKADAAAHRRAVGDVLARVLGEGFAEVPADPSPARRAEHTLALLSRQVPAVWAARLPDDASSGRRGSTDLLVHTGHGYVPVLVVRHKVTDPGEGALTGPLSQPVPAAAGRDPARKPRPDSRDAFRLAHAFRLLQAASAAGEAVGGVIGPDADLVVWHDLAAPSWPGQRSTLEEYDARFADRQAVARAAATGAEPLAHPSRITECRSCPWWTVCGAELLAARDVSLVVRGQDAATLRAAGIRTVDELAGLDAPQGPPSLDMPVTEAVVLARAWQRDLALVRRHPEIPVPRADIEVDIDMESFGESGAYLWGCLASGGLDPGYHGFVTWKPLPCDDEARSFAEFWSWLAGMRARAAAAGRSFAAYCYNEHAENRWMLASAHRFAGHPGVPTIDEVQAFIDSPQWVDLYRVVNRGFFCAQGKGLKTVARVAGFSWRDPEAGGENSMRWYREAVGLDGDPPDATQRDRLLRYNADDVHATRALRRWLDSPAVADVPLAAELTPLS